jgi:Tol biopolymer transport system component
MDTDRGGALTPLTFEGQNSWPIWTPDGNAVLYWSRRIEPSVSGIYRARADGSGQPTLVVDTPIEMRPSSISASGDVLLATQLDPSDKRILNRIFAIPLKPDGTAAGAPRPWHEARANEYYGQLSPDGSQVAYVSDEAGVDNIYLQPFSGRGPTIRISTDVGSDPRWSSDGHTLYFRRAEQRKDTLSDRLRGDQMLMAVDVRPGSRPGAARELFRLPLGPTWDLSPDGNRFLVERPDSTPDNATSRFVFVTNWLDELRARMTPAR